VTQEAMRCVPTQKATVGKRGAKRTLTVERFFLDEKAVTKKEYAACVDAGACQAPKIEQREPAADPARVDWGRAERYCAWAGKRLPTSPEWELGVRAGVGATEMEWTSTNYVSAEKCRKPGADLEEESEETWARAVCGTVDRLDACDGAVLCGKIYRRVVKDPNRPTTRRGFNAFRDKRALAFRCATSTERLTAFPASATRAPLAAPPKPAAPSAEQRAAFLAIKEDNLDIPECEEAGRSHLDCRDPRSYLKTNEPLIGVVLPYVKNRGGGYTGVGSDQNYTLIAAARSQWVWLFDYDEHVVNWHKVLRALILAADTPAAFVAFFDESNLKAGKEAIARVYDKRAQRRILQRLYRGAAPPLARHYRRLATDPDQAYSWLGDAKAYGIIRRLYQQGRIQAFKGNMLEKHTMTSIGKSAKKLGVPIRVYYPSNAPEFWELTEQYRKNVWSLPFDDHSVVVQTISGKSMKTGFGQKGYWHYNVQHGLQQQALLKRRGITRHRQLLYHRVKTDSPELTLTGMP
jgi:hypothetical protein